MTLVSSKPVTHLFKPDLATLA